MRLVGREHRALYVLDEVIAPRSELTRNVWALGSPVARNEAVSHHQLESRVIGTIPDATPTLGGGIAVNGAKGYLCSGLVTTISDPTTESRCCIGRDRAVAERQRPPIIGDATSTSC